MTIAKWITNWADRNATYIIVCLLVLPLIAAFLVVPDTGYRLAWKIAYIAAYILLIVLCAVFVAWRRRKFSITSIPQVWAFIIPALVLSMIFIWFKLFATVTDSEQLSLVIATAFGLASVLGLAISIAVLVSLHRVITQETQLLEESIALLKSVNTNLTFIALSPNLGYAACVKSGNVQPIHEYCRALERALSRLNAATTHVEQENTPAPQHLSDADGPTVRMAYFNDGDITRFFNDKRSALSLVDEASGHTYRAFSDALKTMVETEFQGHNTERFRLRKLKPCLTETGPVEVRNAAHFPPLSILIADTHKAIIFYNQITSEAIPLKGHIAETPDEVRAITVLSESYYRMYTE